MQEIDTDPIMSFNSIFGNDYSLKAVIIAKNRWKLSRYKMILYTVRTTRNITFCDFYGATIYYHFMVNKC